MIASLKLNDHNYDVWLFEQQFNIPTGWNGLPHSSFVGDGQLRLFMTTPEDNYILELMLKTEKEPIAEGSLEIYNETNNLPLRRVEFSKAFIVSYKETFDILNDTGMTTYVQISPMKMTIDKVIDVERRIFWLWNRSPQKLMHMKEVIADNNVHINDAYWINPEGKKCREFFVGEEVKLYLVLGNYNVGQMVQFNFEEVGDEGIFHASCSGETNDKGIVIIEKFKLQKKGEKA